MKVKIVSRLISNRKDLDSVHTLRQYGRPLSVQKNINHLELFEISKDAAKFGHTGKLADNPDTSRQFTYFKKKIKAPCRVVLKAPFHYKKGKHRLTLLQRRLTLQHSAPLYFSRGANSLKEFLVE